VGQQEAATHTAVMIGADETALPVTATMDSDVVVFLVDRSANFSREGTISG